MINLWTSSPESVKISLLVVMGLVSGAVANWAIYTLAYFPRPISPWGKAHPDVAPRTWAARLPVIGWWFLRQEASVHGAWFWLRPCLIELATPCAFVWYYTFTCVDFKLFPELLRNQAALQPVAAGWMPVLLFAHLTLFTLMVAATFIDFDEQTVPDWITIPGTLFGMLIAAFGTQLFLPSMYFPAGRAAQLVPTLLSASNAWPEKLSGPSGLWLALLVYSLWCFALADRRWITRRGFAKTIEYFFAGLVRHESWKILVAIWVAGLFFIGIVYGFGGDHWRGLLTSLVGIAVGGGCIWAVRLVAGWAMGQEAMGFGDVTLMGMIGAYVGWQASLIAFVLAPLTAIFIVLIQFIITKNRVTPFGPYLCAGTVVTVLAWTVMWESFGDPAFSLGFILLPLLASLLALMGAMLFIWRRLKEAIA